jgi:hypothetical protein
MSMRCRSFYKTPFESERFSDITVVIGDREAKFHKRMLSGCDYFERMLSTEFKAPGGSGETGLFCGSYAAGD